jgi:Fe-S-cluster-containing dehydrogenase component
MLINTTRCVGCYACRVACQMQNSLPATDAYIRYEEVESGSYPTVYAEQVPLQCQHCEDAPCVNVCPTGASYINNEGIVLVNGERCIGCKYCMTACPYNARVQDHATGEVEKCRFCVWHDDGSVPEPACVDTCITGARIFGDLDDPASEIAKAVVDRNAKPLAPGLTRAKIYYVR